MFKTRCNLSPIRFNVYINDVLWQQINKTANYTHNVNRRKFVTTIADDQAIIAGSEYSLRKAVHE